MSTNTNPWAPMLDAMAYTKTALGDFADDYDLEAIAAELQEIVDANEGVADEIIDIELLDEVCDRHALPPRAEDLTKIEGVSESYRGYILRWDGHKQEFGSARELEEYANEHNIYVVDERHDYGVAEWYDGTWLTVDGIVARA